MGTSTCLLSTIIAILVMIGGGEAQTDEETTDMALSMFETCPCLPVVVCPHVYGSNPEDEKYFGTVLKCEKPEDVRCCGASTSVVTSKAVLPVNLPEEYQKMAEPSPSVKVLPMEVVTAEPLAVETTTDSEVVATTDNSAASYKHELPVAEGRTAKFTPEEIETMKQRLREMLRQRDNPDLVYQESRFRKTYQSTEATTTTLSTTRRSRFSKKDTTVSTSTAALIEARPPIVLMHKFDTRNRQNFLKSGRTTAAPTTTTQTTSTTTESMDFEDDEEDAEEDDDSLLDSDVAESEVVGQVVEVPKRPASLSATRGRMRFSTSTTTLPRTRKTRLFPVTPTTTERHSHAMKMAILEDVNNQISEKRAAAKEFKGSTLLDFYFEKEEQNVPTPKTTERPKRAYPVYHSGFMPTIFI